MIFKIASVFHKKRIAFQCPQIGVVHFLVLWKCIFSDLIIIIIMQFSVMCPEKRPSKPISSFIF